MNRDARILSGIQPTGKLHLGNYLGALKNWVALQDEFPHACYYCIVDLHAITAPYDPKELKTNVFDTALDFLAAGLDPDKAAIFIQSQVSEHSELAWLLNTITPIGMLERMTQYKDKKKKHVDHINAGLLNYPVLMAADILLYKATMVPVGDDQVQHLELTREIARKFNHSFGDVFPEPEPRLTRGARIMSLLAPDNKMSKSDTEKSYITLDEDPERIKNKLKKAVTDAGTSGELGPGAKNLLTIMEVVDPDAADRFAKDATEGQIRYSDLKMHLADKLGEYFAPFRERRRELAARPDTVWELLLDGTQQARRIASATFKEAKEKMGFI
ncbi:MAG: tryptophan--tRNA ligase [Candidatus Latescibacterota bacterium]|nr:MAG: tryptophan--tRNA ligase [Candidatus Latescibacterota bacterium]